MNLFLNRESELKFQVNDMRTILARLPVTQRDKQEVILNLAKSPKAFQATLEQQPELRTR